MAQPLYFLPHLNPAQVNNVAARKQMLRERGLIDVFADVPMEQMPCVGLTGRGPGNLSGSILYYQSPKTDIPRRTYYKPEEQQWTPIGDGSLVWIGIDTDDPPTPDDLIRRHVYEGYKLDLADGKSWKVPVIRSCCDGSTSLPTDMVWDATGQLIEPIKPAYKALWDETGEVARWFVENLDANRSDALRHAVKALGINYRFGVNEQNVLRVIDATNFMGVLMAMVDYPTYQKLQEAQKKTCDSLSTPSSTDGLPEETPATDQAAAS